MSTKTKPHTNPNLHQTRCGDRPNLGIDSDFPFKKCFKVTEPKKRKYAAACLPPGGNVPPTIVKKASPDDNCDDAKGKSNRTASSPTFVIAGSNSSVASSLTDPTAYAQFQNAKETSNVPSLQYRDRNTETSVFENPLGLQPAIPLWWKSLLMIQA